MKLVSHYAPVSVFSPFAEIERELERVWGRGTNGAGTETAETVPSTDVKEDARQWTVTLDLPGVRREDVQVSLEEGVLSITGERRQETETVEGQFHRRERVVGRFARRFTVGTALPADGVKATFKDGVLTVVLPKPTAVQPRTIQIAAE